MNLIARLKKKRLSEGLSLRQLGSMIGVSFSSLARLERGIGEPDVHSRERIERWLETGEGSQSRVRQVGEENWHARMERRIVALERALGLPEEKGGVDGAT